MKRDVRQLSRLSNPLVLRNQAALVERRLVLRRIRAVVLVLLLTTTSLHAETSPPDDAAIQAALQSLMTQIQEGKAESLFARPPEEGACQPAPLQEHLPEQGQEQDQRPGPLSPPSAKQDSLPEGAFRQHYLEKFFPRALVIGGGYFPYMTPRQIDAALGDIINLFSHQAWYYFVNEQNKFKQTVFWEYIVDQLSIVHEYLVRYCVNPVDKSICQPTRGVRGSKIWLFDYLKDEESSTAYTFMALAYDWVNRLFIEAVMMENITQAKAYYKDLAYLLNSNLKGSIYEREYSEHLTLARELLDTLRNRLGLTDEQVDSMMSNKQGKFGPGY